MNKELLNAIYDHREICRAIEQQDHTQAMKLWEEKAALLKNEGPVERTAMLESLSQSVYIHILQVRGYAPTEYRHKSRDMYTRVLSQNAMIAHGREMICQYMLHMNTIEKESNHIDMACCYIATHLSEPITLETVAKHVFVSKCYLCRMFRNQMGQSFSQYVTNQRLDRAEHLLKHSNLSIDRIAEQCGFSSPAYFATSFRRRNQVSPSNYRKQLQTQEVSMGEEC